MIILCVSDQIDPQIYTSTIKQSYSDVDIVLSAGDLPADYLDFITNTLRKPLFFVHGNHHTDNRPKEAHSVNRKVCCNAGLIVAGLGGSRQMAKRISSQMGIQSGAAPVPSFKGVNQYSDLQMTIAMLKLAPMLLFNRIFRRRFLDILLTHAPVQGIHDAKGKDARGFKCFLLFLKIFKPKYLVHGHIHYYDPGEDRTTQLGNTLIINAYGHYLIDTGENT